MTQGSLFDIDASAIVARGLDDHPAPRAEPELPPHNGSATSREAAEAMRSSVAGLRSLVLETIRAAGPEGRTADEVMEITGISHASCSQRPGELAKAGLVVPKRDADGEVVKRPTRSARKTRAVVWVAAEFAGKTEA